MSNLLTQEVEIPVIKKKVPVWAVGAAGIAGLFVLLKGQKPQAQEAQYIEEERTAPGNITPGSISEITPGPGPGQITELQQETTEQNTMIPPGESLTFSDFTTAEAYNYPEMSYYGPVYTPPAEAAQTQATKPTRNILSADTVKSTVKSAEMKKAVRAGTFDFTQEMYNAGDLSGPTIQPADKPEDRRTERKEERVNEIETTQYQKRDDKPQDTTTTKSAPKSNTRSRTSSNTTPAPAPTTTNTNRTRVQDTRTERKERG